jgi:hypothetical protein
MIRTVEYSQEVLAVLLDLRAARDRRMLTQPEYTDMVGRLLFLLGGTNEQFSREEIQSPAEKVPERYKGTLRDFENFGSPVLVRRWRWWRFRQVPDFNRRRLTELALCTLPRVFRLEAVRVTTDLVRVVHLEFLPPL